MKTKKSSLKLYFKEAGNSYFDDVCERQVLPSSRLISLQSKTVLRRDWKLWRRGTLNSLVLSPLSDFNAEFENVLLLILQSRQLSVCSDVNDSSTVTTTDSSLIYSTSRLSGVLSMSSFLTRTK